MDSVNFNRFTSAFGTPKDVIAQLVDTTNLEAVLMDSYLLTRYHEVIKREPVRVKQNYEQPINYGLAMAPNSTNFTECFTRYVHNYPQEIFNSVRNNYKPLKVTSIGDFKSCFYSVFAQLRLHDDSKWRRC